MHTSTSIQQRRALAIAARGLRWRSVSDIQMSVGSAGAAHALATLIERGHVEVRERPRAPGARGRPAREVRVTRAGLDALENGR